jgi:hypothetical protein
MSRTTAIKSSVTEVPMFETSKAMMAARGVREGFLGSRPQNFTSWNRQRGEQLLDADHFGLGLAFEILNSAQDRVDTCGEVSTLGIVETITKSFSPRTHRDDIISEVAELRGDHTTIENKEQHRAVEAPEFRLSVDMKAR